MIGAIGNFVPTTIRINLSELAKASNGSKPLEVLRPQTTQEIPPPVTSVQSSFGDKLSIPFELSPSEFSTIFGSNAVNNFFSDVLPQAVTASYTQSNLLTAKRLSITA